MKKRKKYGNVTHWHPLFFIGRFPDGPGVRQAAERPRYIDTARPVLWAALGWLFFVEEFSYPRGACVWWRGREAGRQARWYTLLPSRFRKGFCVCVLLPPTSRESFRKHIYISRKNSCIVHIFATSPHRYILYEINVSKRLIFLTLVFLSHFRIEPEIFELLFWLGFHFDNLAAAPRPDDVKFPFQILSWNTLKKSCYAIDL